MGWRGGWSRQGWEIAFERPDIGCPSNINRCTLCLKSNGDYLRESIGFLNAR